MLARCKCDKDSNGPQVRRKCETGAYSGPQAFAADMRQVFSNAHTYNKAGTDVYVMATTLSVRFLIRPPPIAVS